MSKLDVQLHPTGVAIIPPDEAWDENLPGQINLTNDEADDLRDMLNEAWLNRHGLESRSVRAADVEEEDVMPATGQSVKAIVTHRGLTTLVTGETSAFSLPDNLEITVHRRIQ